MTKLNRFQVLFNRLNGIALAVFLLCWLVCWWLQHPELNLLTPDGFQLAVKSLGFAGPLLYIVGLTVSVVISPIPSAPLAVVAGAIWGPVLAGIYSVIGGFLGSLIAYFLGRTLGRSAIKALTGKIIYFSKKRGEIYLGWFIFITRLLPVLSFDLISYAAGIANLSLPIYVTATLLGMIPSTLLLTSMGKSFTLGLPLGITFSLIFLLLLVGVPWAIRKYNWLGMKDVVRIE